MTSLIKYKNSTSEIEELNNDFFHFLDKGRPMVAIDILIENKKHKDFVTPEKLNIIMDHLLLDIKYKVYYAIEFLIIFKSNKKFITSKLLNHFYSKVLSDVNENKNLIEDLARLLITFKDYKDFANSEKMHYIGDKLINDYHLHKEGLKLFKILKT